MKKIIFNSVVPEVFLQRKDLNSEIWNKNVRFEKDIYILLKLIVEKVRVLFVVIS